MYSVVDTHCSTTVSLILPGIFERIVDMNLHERGKGFVERERERDDKVSRQMFNVSVIPRPIFKNKILNQ